MARLNDLAQNGQQAHQPPTMYPAETVEALRRKMLRQNRELARVNSTQAIRLRQLEAECARILSENLELRSSILRMEKEAEDDKTARIAEHALEIKAKLEAQLAGMSDLLSSLGSEPPAKRQSLSPRKIATPKTSTRRRSNGLRNMAKELEERAMDQGRLAPIMENNTYSRAPESPEQLASPHYDHDSADISTSPALGSPPSSRFVDEESIIETPTKKPISFIQSWNKSQPIVSVQPDEPTLPSLEPRSPSPIAVAPIELAKPIEKPTVVPMPAPKMPAPKTGKRKLGNDIPEPSRASDGDRGNSVTRKPNGKILKETAVARKETHDKNSEVSEAPRKPLAAKSTNKDLSTPRRADKENGKKGEKAKANKFTENEKSAVHEHSRSRNREHLQQPINIIEPTATIPKRPETIVLLPDEPSITESEIVMRSPTPKAAEENSRLGDTPPPAHISSEGETSRPSRRSRSAVSYAEPNLRDKMRRPTKELFDAVAGEGKYMRRSSSSLSKQDIPAIDLFSKPQGRKSTEVVPTEKSVEPLTAIPMEITTDSSSDTSKLVENDILPSSVVTDRRKRRSSAAWDVPAPEAPETTSIGPINPDDISDDVDLYEFTVSSPVVEKRQNRRRASATTADPDYVGKTEKPAWSRKRATMSAAKRSRADMEASLFDESENSMTDSSSASTTSRTKAVIRRKSTMA